jgi:hypothetical protein
MRKKVVSFLLPLGLVATSGVSASAGSITVTARMAPTAPAARQREARAARQSPRPPRQQIPQTERLRREAKAGMARAAA